jgi:hypothetical protein
MEIKQPVAKFDQERYMVVVAPFGYTLVDVLLIELFDFSDHCFLFIVSLEVILVL